MSAEREQKKTERLHMLISPAELDAIDNWRFAYRLGTRAEAVRQLVNKGLTADREINEVTTLLEQASYRIRFFRRTIPDKEITKSFLNDEISKLQVVIEDSYDRLEKLLGAKK